MRIDDTTVTLLARLAAAERALARRRVDAARAQGLDARSWCGSDRAYVATLARHEELAAIVTEAFSVTPVSAWSARMSPLDGCSPAAVRAVRAAWRAELVAYARGEDVRVTEVPSDEFEIADEPVVKPVATDDPNVEVEAPPAPPPKPVRPIDPERVKKRLGQLIERFFQSSPTDVEPVDEEPDAPPPPTVRTAWYEVAPRGDGAMALWMVCSPCGVFPAFAKVLRATQGAWRASIRRENLATQGARFEVPLSSDAITWSTGDDESDSDLASELAALAPTPLASDRVTVFRLDVEGPTQRLEGSTLSRGARYAVAVPPRDGRGWTLDVLDVPALPSEELIARSNSLGLAIGALSLDASWVLVPPARWERSERGARYPVFESARAPVIRLRAGVSRRDLVVFLHGEHAQHSYALATTDGIDLSLDDLAPGRYVLEFTATDREVQPARCVFVVEAQARARVPVSTPTVTLDGEALSPGAVSVADLSSVAPSRGFEVRGPPALSFSLRWSAHSTWDSGLCSLDERGRASLDDLMARCEPLRAVPEARLTVDFGEWGLVTVHHRRRIDDVLSAAREAFRTVSERRALLGAGVTDLAQAWLRGAAEALGFSARVIASPIPVAALDDLEFDPAGVRVVTRATLVAVPAGARLRHRDEPLRAAIDAACLAVAPRAIVTDGERWWDLDLRKSTAPMPDALGAALDDDESLAGFLARYSAWR